jgi:N-acetylneuraminic acid mutarotase
MRNSITTLLWIFTFVTQSISQGYWTQKATFPGAARYDAMSFEIGTKGYVIGGFDGGTTFFKDVWEYDAVNNTWTQKQNFNSTRWMSISFSIGSKGYIATGDGSTNYPNDFWEYNSSTDTWNKKSSPPIAGRAAGIGFAINGHGYIGLGYDTSNIFHKDLWEYDTATNNWSQKADFPGGKRAFAVGLSINGRGYVGTGKDSTTDFYNDFWEYDPLMDLWNPKPAFPNGDRTDIDGAHFNIGTIGIIGAGWYQPSISNYNDFWGYNPANNSWSQIPSLPAAGREGAINFSIGNKGYIGLGAQLGSVSYNDLWEYTDTTFNVGTSEIKTKAAYSAYPNPTSNTTTIDYQLPSGNQQGEIVFYDLQGKEIKRFHLDNTSNSLLLSTSDLPAGTYYYHLQTANNTSAGKKLVVIK